jgi:hypothetical protein
LRSGSGSFWRILRRNQVQGVTIPTVDISELPIAEAKGVLQHGLEHRLKITRRPADNPKHL